MCQPSFGTAQILIQIRPNMEQAVSLLFGFFIVIDFSMKWGINVCFVAVFPFGVNYSKKKNSFILMHGE